MRLAARGEVSSLAKFVPKWAKGENSSITLSRSGSGVLSTECRNADDVPRFWHGRNGTGQSRLTCVLIRNDLFDVDLLRLLAREMH
jgi:hypothetical protein